MFGLIHRKTGDASTLRKRQFWQRFSGDSLFKLIIMVSAFSISYEGMSQGIAGAVTVAPEFIYRMGFGDAAGNVTKPTLQGGIVSIYYAGSLFGGFFAGSFRSIFFRYPSAFSELTLVTATSTDVSPGSDWLH